MTCNFNVRGFDLKIKGLNGFNYRLKVHPLNKDINESESRIQVKSNSVTITLVKKGKENWGDLKDKPIPFGAKPKKSEEGAMPDDPQASLMNMMKEMYESGDDEMKKVIAQSWQKAHDEQMGKKEKKQ